MQLGMVGLGRMGANMTARLVAGGHRVVAWDRAPVPVARAVEGGAEGAASLDALVEALAAPRAVWIMVPSGEPTALTSQALSRLHAPGDNVIAGGNSN